MRWPRWGGCHQQQSGIWEAPYCWWQPEIRLHNQLRLVVYPIIHRGFIHPTGALGFLPSAVATWLTPGNGPWLCASSSSWRLHGVLGVWRWNIGECLQLDRGLWHCSRCSRLFVTNTRLNPQLIFTSKLIFLYGAHIISANTLLQEGTQKILRTKKK